MHGNQPPFEKHSERIIPNQWRKIGTQIKLNLIGGFVICGKNKNQFKKVKKGTFQPKMPNMPQFTFHQDFHPSKNRRPIIFEMPKKEMPGDEAAHILAKQLQNRMTFLWKKESWYDFKDEPISKSRSESIQSSQNMAQNKNQKNEEIKLTF